jgi:DNA-directed RNA polymerase specialized sigma24 family protein
LPRIHVNLREFVAVTGTYRPQAPNSSRCYERSWLYRIATNACLTALESRPRRPLPQTLSGPSGTLSIENLQPSSDVPTRANGQPALAAYLRRHDDTHRFQNVQVFTLDQLCIARIDGFFGKELPTTFGGRTQAPQSAATRMQDCVARLGTTFHEVVTYQPTNR